MDKTELFLRINDMRREQSLPPMSKAQFIAALSGLEAQGYIRTEDNQCFKSDSELAELENDGGIKQHQGI